MVVGPTLDLDVESGFLNNTSAKPLDQFQDRIIFASHIAERPSHGRSADTRAENLYGRRSCEQHSIKCERKYTMKLSPVVYLSHTNCIIFPSMANFRPGKEMGSSLYDGLCVSDTSDMFLTNHRENPAPLLSLDKPALDHF
jgi:hypothetical protein